MAEAEKKSKFNQIVTVARIQRACIATKNVASLCFFAYSGYLLFAESLPA